MSEARAEQQAFGWAERVLEQSPAGSSARTVPEAPTRPAATRCTRARRDRRASAPGAVPSARSPEVGAAALPLPPDDELWDVHAAARYLKRSVSWVYHRAEDGSLPVRRIGGWGLRFIPAELRAWVATGGAPRRRAAKASEV